MKSSVAEGDASGESFADRLSTAIAARRVSLTWLRDRLADRGDPVSLTTLSYWRAGTRNPEGAGSLAAVATIEELLGLPPGHLAARLGPTRRTGPMAIPEIPIDDEAVRRATEQTLDALGAAPTTALRDVNSQVVADVDEHGRVVRRATRVLAQATSGTITELPWVEVASAPTSSVPRITALGGARVVRSHRHEGGQVHGFVFALERPVTAPGTTLFEFVSELDADYPQDPEVGHLLTRRARETLIWVRFHPDRLPAWVEEQAGEEVRRIDLGPGHTAHARRAGFGPGILAVRWGY